MQTDTRAQATGSGYATAGLTKAPAWHGLVACDTWFNGLTTGLFLGAATSELVSPEVFATLAKAAYPVAFALLVVDLVCLVLDLGDPLRFHHMLRVFKPGSPMSLGVWCLTMYSLPLTVAAAVSLVSGGGIGLEWLRRLAVVLGLLPALGSAVYKGVLFSTSAQPGWKDARWLGAYLTSAAVTLGCAELLGLAIQLGNERAAANLRPALGLLLVINAVPLCLLLAEVRTPLSRAYTPGELWLLGAVSIGLGLVIPLCLVVAGGSPLMLGAVVVILVGSLVSRFVLVRLPHGSVGVHQE